MPTAVDSYHQSILTGLARTLSGELFQECVASILRPTFPSLVCLNGGSDEGADGLYIDESSRVLPLVVTISDDVIGNVTANLTEYISKHPKHPSGKVLVATSQQLSARRLSNIRRRVRDLGFADALIYDRSEIASRLYESPQWCRRLLQLTGDPPALSSRSRTTRVLTNLPLHGRDEDLRWLLASTSDCLLVGQPGSGKTALLTALCNTTEAFFVRSKNGSAIADEIRSKRPRILILDDAHTGDQLAPAELADIRTATGSDFAIVIGSWPSSAVALGRSLNATGLPSRHLKLLSRDSIVQVLKDYGLARPSRLVRLIVDQARGRPGLAITLANLAFAGAIDDLLNGKALVSDLVVPLEDRHRLNIRAVLAAIGLGGRAGMNLGAIASSLQYSPADVRSACSEMAAAGILSEIASSRLSVQPDALRHALVRDSFFCGACSLPESTLRELQDAVPSPVATTIELVAVASHGGDQARPALERMLDEFGDPEAWTAYASLGHSETLRALERCPGRLKDLERIGLMTAPRETLIRLFEAARGDSRNLESNPDHALRIVQDWVEAGYPGTEHAVARRKLLIHTALAWHTSGGDETVTTRAIVVAFSPRFQSLDTDPGAGHTVTITTGSIAAADVDALAEGWEPTIAHACRHPFSSLSFLFSVLARWSHPGLICLHGLDDAVRDRLRFHSSKMFDDVRCLARGHPAAMERIRREAEYLDKNVDCDSDMTLFRTLYPANHDFIDEDLRRNSWRALETLADSLTALQPRALAQRLSWILSEARVAGLSGETRISQLAVLLTDRVSNLMKHVIELRSAKLPAEIVAPFLFKLASNSSHEAKKVLEETLWDDELAQSSARATLILTDPEQKLWRRACDLLSASAAAGSLWLDLESCPPENIRSLLIASDPNLVLSALISCQLAEMRGHPGLSLTDERRSAALALASQTEKLRGHESLYLSEIVGKDPGIAFEWLRRFAASGEAPYEFSESLLSKIVATLSTDERRKVIDDIPNDTSNDVLLRLLLKGDLAAYEHLLQDSNRPNLHLIPLETKPDEEWFARALAAKAAGYSPEKVSDAVYGDSWEWTGDVSEMFDERCEVFASLEQHADLFIRLVGSVGRDRSSKYRDLYKRREQNEQVYGRES